LCLSTSRMRPAPGGWGTRHTSQSSSSPAPQTSDSIERFVGTKTTLRRLKRPDGRLRGLDSPLILEPDSYSFGFVAAMWDRYDPRSSDGRDRGDSYDRTRGTCGGSNDCDRTDERDPRDVFTKDVDLPRGRERRPVRDRDHIYEIDGSESRMLGTIGAFRVVPESDLHDARHESRETRQNLRHLEEEGLIRRSPLSADDRAVVLTDRGKDLLEANRHEHSDRTWEPRQTFYAGLRKPRELTHDAQVYRAYERAEERLRDQGGRVKRVVLDYELKRDYQRFLHERNRGKKDCDGRPDREAEEIARWAREHELPYEDGHVQFPDARIEYEDRDGCSRHQDLEIVTHITAALMPERSRGRGSAVTRSAEWSAVAVLAEAHVEAGGLLESSRSCSDETAACT